jgi:hypothetical protein
LSAHIAASRAEIEQSVLRILVRCAPPPEVRDFGRLHDPEQVRLDPEAARIALRWHGRDAFTGPMQVIGYHDARTDVFRWSWQSPAAPAAAWERVRAFCAATRELQAVAAEPSFACSPRFAELLGGWIACQMQYTGSYSDRSDPHQTMIVAVEHLEPETGETFCGFCFCSSQGGQRMIAFTAGLAVCDTCIGTLQDTLAVWGGSVGAPPPPTLDLACLICGDQAALIHGSHASICTHCIDTAVRALG